MEYKIKENQIIKYKEWKREKIIVPTYIHKIGYEAFREHNEIKEVVLPPTIQSISFKAFYKFRGIVHQENEIKKEEWKDKKIGDTILFGKYPHNELGQEQAIEWIILDEKADAYLLLSKQCIDCQQYHSDWQVISWKNSDIRQWLNTLFYDYAFDSLEKQKIKEINIEALQTINIKENETTKDKVFLLSKEEVLKYFPIQKERITYPTSHVIIKGMDDYYKACWWWVRNPGEQAEYVAVGTNGKIYEFGIYMTYYHGIRPSMWIEK